MVRHHVLNEVKTLIIILSVGEAAIAAEAHSCTSRSFFSAIRKMSFVSVLRLLPDLYFDSAGRGAEGTVVEGEDASCMIWGLNAGEKLEGDAAARIIEQVTRIQPNAGVRHRTTSAERPMTVNGDAANRNGPVQGSVRPGDSGRDVPRLRTAPARQPDEHSPREARQRGIPAPSESTASPSAHGTGGPNASLKPSAPTFVPKSPPGLHRPSAAEPAQSMLSSSIAPTPVRRLSAMEIAQQYRQSQLQPAFAQRSPTPEWSFSPYLEPISAPPTFASRSRPVRHGFDDIYLPKPDSPIRIDMRDAYSEPPFDDIYVDVAQTQHYPEPGIPRTPIAIRRPVPPVIGEHREQVREEHVLMQQSLVPDEFAHAQGASRRVHYSQYEPDVYHSPTSALSTVNHRSPKPPGPPPNTPLPPLPARAPRRVLQEYIMYEDPADEEYAIRHTADLHQQPRSVPLARLMQRRLSAVPEELEDISVHHERPPPPPRPAKATHASTVLRQPLPPSAQPSWRAKTKFPVPKETEALSRGPTRVRRVVLVEEDEDPYRWGPSLANTTQDRDNSKRVPLTPMTNRSRSSSIASSSKGDQEPGPPIDKENKTAEPARKPKKKVRGGRKIKSKKAANK